jgi:DNA mismatch repair ATPase MutS
MSLRNIASNGKEYLLQLQQQENDATGISSLKIGFNNVFGYYLEVTNTHKNKVPAALDTQANTGQCRTVYHTGVKGI